MSKQYHFVVTFSEEHGWGVDLETTALWASDGNVWQEATEEWVRVPWDEEETILADLEKRLQGVK